MTLDPASKNNFFDFWGLCQSCPTEAVFIHSFFCGIGERGKRYSFCFLFRTRGRGRVPYFRLHTGKCAGCQLLFCDPISNGGMAVVLRLVRDGGAAFTVTGFSFLGIDPWELTHGTNIWAYSNGGPCLPSVACSRRNLRRPIGIPNAQRRRADGQATCWIHKWGLGPCGKTYYWSPHTQLYVQGVQIMWLMTDGSVPHCVFNVTN